MLTYIPNRIDPENLDDWKNIMKNTINQIVQYPEAKRPYCDKTQLTRLFNILKLKDHIVI